MRSFYRLILLALLLIGGRETISAQAEFVKNEGQWESQILFKCRLNNGALFIEKNALTWYFYDMPFSHPVSFPKQGFNLRHAQVPSKAGPQDPSFQTLLKAHAYRVTFTQASENTATEGRMAYQHVNNYFIGKDPSHWRSGVKSYEKIYISDLYPGIDLELFSADNHTIKYNFLVKAGVDIGLIKMKYEGVTPFIQKNGKLQIKTTVKTITEEIPLTFFSDGQGETIPCHYILSEEGVGFNCGQTKFNRPLVIDPKLVFSTYSGSTADNWGFTGTYDITGHGYSGGIVFDVGFPSTTGAFQVNFGGGVFVTGTNGDVARDMGILKYAPDGKSLIYATYLGGSHNEQPHSMVVNNAGELCILGTTYSQDFPGTNANSFQRTLAGEGDMILLKLKADGSSILAATFLGGNFRDGFNGLLDASDHNTSPLGWNYGDMFRGEIICDSADNIYIASTTESGDNSGLPLKNGEWTNYGGGDFDGFVAKFNTSLSNLNWSSYIGGTSSDAAYGLYIYNDELYVCGGTNSNNMRLSNPTSSPLSKSFSGGIADGYVIHFNASTGKVAASTYLGTSGYDQAFFVQVDKYGKPFVFGQSNSGSWPVTNPIYNNAGATQFITKFNEKLSSIDRSTTFGSGRKIPDISPSAFLVDRCGRIFVSGWGGRVNNAPQGNGGNTNGMPITPNAYDKVTDGSDFYLGVFNKELDTLIYGTYFGGHAKGSDGLPLAEHVDGGTSRFDYEGRVYQSVCAGCGGQSSFPTTPGAFSQINKNTNCNNALFKIDFENLNYKPIGSGTSLELYAGDTIIYDYVAKDLDRRDSLFISRVGNVFGNPLLPPFAEMPENSGLGEVRSTFKWMPWCQHVSNDTYYVYVRTRDNNECPKPDTSYDVIKLHVKMPPAIKPPDVVCVAHVNQTTVNITWAKTDENKYFKYYLLYRRDPLGNTIILDTIYRNQTGLFIDDKSPNHQFANYCYFMQGVNICDIYGDTSYKACSADDFDNPIDSVYLITATVVDNKYIQLKWFQSKESDFGSYLVFRYSNNFKGNNIPIFYQSIDNISDTIFNDSSVSVMDSSYCYLLKVTDKCGHISRYSNLGCTILLKGESATYEHLLSWSDYRSWQGGVLNYEVQRADSIENYFLLVDKTDPTNLKYIDTTMFYDWGQYTYKIVANEGYKGFKARSESNWISLIQKPLLWVPDAFTPNGDNINDNWGWQSVFVKTMEIWVYNRWGELIFTTNNKKDFWNGIYRDKSFDNNVYIWRAVYTGWDSSRHTQIGNVTVLK